MDLAAGLAGFLGREWGGPVTVSGLAASSAGARRANVAFDAETADGGMRRLVATIVPIAAMQLNRIDAEVEVRTLVRQRGVPVPEVVTFSTNDSWVGGPFFLSERIEGETVPRRVLRLVEERGIGDLVAGQLGNAVGCLHTIDPADVAAELLDLGPGAPAEQALAALEEVMAGLLEPRPALTYGLRWLQERLPAPPAAESVVHTDIRTGNLIVGEDGLRAVLDWEGTRRRGDPMEDLAWLALRVWRFRNDDREIGGFSSLAPFVEAYEAAGGRFHPERYRWWKVYCTLKWGLGLAAQAARHLDGRFRSIVMAASGRRVPEMEWDLLMLINPGVRR